jgi:hypothetical protein
MTVIDHDRPVIGDDGTKVQTAAMPAPRRARDNG